MGVMGWYDVRFDRNILLYRTSAKLLRMMIRRPRKIALADRLLAIGESLLSNFC